MTIKTIITSAVAVIVGVPMAVVLIAIGWISVLDRTNGSLVLSGETRRYLLHVPASYDPRTPTPLVISMHAGATWPAHQANLSHWNRLTDEHGFIVVYPSGIPAVFNVTRIWRTTPETVMADVRFLSTLIDTLEAAYTIDPARIYANGMSLGGGMAFALSCALPDRIAAVGVVAAVQTPLPGLCTGTRPMPLMAFHGDADPVVPYGGGRLGDPFNPVKPVYPPVQGWVANAAAETNAEPMSSSLWSLPTFGVPPIQHVLEALTWCSIPSGEQATPGPAASRRPSGGSGRRIPASTPRP